MSNTDVADEFECHLKCLGNNSCKSFNVHPGANNAKRICELNNNTRQMKPEHFKWKKGSTYYGSVQVSSKVCVYIFISHFRLLFPVQNNFMKASISVLSLITRPPASMFHVSGMNKQRVDSVIRDTRGKNVKNVSNENFSFHFF